MGPVGSTPLILSAIDFNGKEWVGKRQFGHFKTFLSIQVRHFLEVYDHMQLIIAI